MTEIITILSLAAVGVVASAFISGGAKNKKTASLWSAAGVLWSAFAGVAVLFCKNAIKEILLKKSPHLAFMTGDITIPLHIMVKLGMTVFVCGLILFLWSYNCRKNNSKWYWAVLWNIGIAFLAGHLLFLPQYYGIAAWVNFFVTAKQDVFSLDISMFPAFYIMIAVNLIAALLWLWYTLKAAKYSWKNNLIFAGCFTGFTVFLWLSAWGIGSWAKNTMDTTAAELGITPLSVPMHEPDELKALVDQDFYTRHSKYNPPRSGRYNWKTDTIPADEKKYTMKFFSSSELEEYLKSLKKSVVYAANKDTLYLSTLQHFRSLVRHRADIAELYFRTNQKEKVLPELLKYPELDRLIPADTPHLICELVRTAGRWIWIDALIQYGPEDKAHLSTYRELLDWSKSWQVHLPHEAGFYLALPVEVKGKVAAFFYTPYLNTTKYRGFSEAVNRIPALKKLEQQEFISENGMYAKAAKRQRLGIVLSQTALALKLFKIEKGEYPQKLSELVPRYLPKEYVSPYTGKKLNYILKDGFFTLASDDRTITSKR